MKSLALARHGRYFYFVITDDRGKRIYRSTERSTKSEALRVLLDFKQRSPGGIHTSGRPTFSPATGSTASHTTPRATIWVLTIPSRAI